MTLPLFLLPDGALDGVQAGTTLALDGDEARHAAQVRRVRVGEEIDVADGSGCVARCRVVTVAPRALALDVVAVRLVPPRLPRLVLVQALAKGGRDELAVQAATELGVDEIIPWQADRCVVRWTSERLGRGLRRWRDTAREATKQSRRPTLPGVADPLDTRRLGGRITSATLALVLHEEAEDPISQVVADLRDAAQPHDVAEPDRTGEDIATGQQIETGQDTETAGDVLVIVGPEGGLGPEELAVLVEAGARAVRLGPEVLRTSTAGPAALAVLSTALGRW